MTSNNIYCVYLTIYTGNKLPPFYIGSGTISKIYNKTNPYRGSVLSIEYKDIWRSELKYNSSAFKIKIIKTFKSRNEAYIYEEYIQRFFGVVKNALYTNKSIANRMFNMFGKSHKESTLVKMRVSGRNKPKASKETRQLMSINNKNKITIFDTRINKFIRTSKDSENYDELVENKILIYTGNLRSKESRQKTSSIISNRSHYYDPISKHHIFIKNTELPPNGYIRGCGENQNEIASKRFKGDSIYHNPETLVQIRLQKSAICPDGFIKGRIDFGICGNHFSYNIRVLDLITGNMKFIKKGNIKKYQVIPNSLNLICINSPRGLIMSYSESILKTYFGTMGIKNLIDNNKIVSNRNKNVWLKENHLNKKISDIGGFKYYPISEITMELIYSLEKEGYVWVL